MVPAVRLSVRLLVGNPRRHFPRFVGANYGGTAFSCWVELTWLASTGGDCGPPCVAAYRCARMCAPRLELTFFFSSVKKCIRKFDTK